MGIVPFIFVFLVLLPLINSIFDWLSLAATRVLLKSIAERDDAPGLQVAWNALVGLILGGLLLAGLAAAATAGVQTVNHLSQSNGGPNMSIWRGCCPGYATIQPIPPSGGFIPRCSPPCYPR